jgi:hypothetical protein
VWENPYYYFRVGSTDELGNNILKIIKIDVTKSAMFKEPSTGLAEVLNILIGKNSEYKISNVLDFGCGKLSTVNYFTYRKKKITVVDFVELLEKHDYLREKLNNISVNQYFSKMDFPNPFIGSNEKYELCILVNVLPVMPVFFERIAVLQLLYNKIKTNKYVLWFAMVKPTKYKRRETSKSTVLGDGIWLGKDIEIY